MAVACAQQGMRTPRGASSTSAPISAGDLRTRLYIFADDSMMGREAGTLGSVKGTAYLASEAARLGLEPAGENGSYFQDIGATSARCAGTAVPARARNVTARLRGSDAVVRDDTI